VQELGFSAQWLEMMEEDWIRMLSGEAPLTFFKQWYNVTSETWLKIVSDIIGTERFVEAASRFLESCTSFYKTFHKASEEYLRTLQIPTRSE
jgi:hypothetical protein